MADTTQNLTIAILWKIEADLAALKSTAKDSQAQLFMLRNSINGLGSQLNSVHTCVTRIERNREQNSA
jgi:hypothetical protein